MSSPRLRLFVAADVPHDHRVRINEWTATWRRASWGGRWLPASSQHVTLKFLGTTPGERLGEVSAALSAVAAAHERAEVSLARVGGFPSLRRARVLWMGLKDPAELMARLAAALDGALEPLGWVPEKRAFTPHLTLARFPSPLRLEGEGLDERPPPPLAPFEVAETVLYRSHLHPRGARYEALESFRLG